MIVRDLYFNVRLVHGDLSEYNMLMHNDEVYVIDVSQSVEMDHPEAQQFLKRDIENLNGFFEKKGEEKEIM
jgi:RIO kinase 1